MCEEPSAIFEKIKNALNGVCKQLTLDHYSETRWTHDVLHSVADVVPSNSKVFLCSSCFSKERRPNCYAGWLYDMTWYIEDAKNRLAKIVLVLESEWLTGEHEMKYDFEKLLQAKCLTKVFICQSDSAKEMAQKGIEAYAKGSKEFQNEDERYLIAIYEDSKKKGEGHFQYFEFNGNGVEITANKSRRIEK